MGADARPPRPTAGQPGGNLWTDATDGTRGAGSLPRDAAGRRVQRCQAEAALAVVDDEGFDELADDEDDDPPRESVR